MAPAENGTAVAVGLIWKGPGLQGEVDGGGPASKPCLRDSSIAGRPARPESPNLEIYNASNRHLKDPGGTPLRGYKKHNVTNRDPEVQIFGARALAPDFAGTSSV